MIFSCLYKCCSILFIGLLYLTISKVPCVVPKALKMFEKFVTTFRVYLTVLLMALSVSPSYRGGGFWNTLCLMLFLLIDLIQIWYTSLTCQEGHKCFLVKMDASFSCYDIIKFENVRKDLIWTSSKWNCCIASI